MTKQPTKSSGGGTEAKTSNNFDSGNYNNNDKNDSKSQEYEVTNNQYLQHQNKNDDFVKQQSMTVKELPSTRLVAVADNNL